MSDIHCISPIVPPKIHERVSSFALLSLFPSACRSGACPPAAVCCDSAATAKAGSSFLLLPLVSSSSSPDSESERREPPSLPLFS